MIQSRQKLPEGTPLQRRFGIRRHGFILCTYAVTVDKGRMWSKGRSVRNVQKKMDPQIAAGADRSDIDPQR